MNRYIFILVIFLSGCTVHPKTEPPNIVLIVADDLGYGDLGCYGCRDIQTPNIDKLASEGVRFTGFYANGPECTPTRAALLSGVYQQRIGGLECAIGSGNVGRYPGAAWLAEKDELGLPVEYSLLPKKLKEKGYATAVIGKWHLGYEPKFRPQNHYFDYSFGPLGYGGDYFYHVELDSTGLHDFTGKHTLAKIDKEVFRDGEYLMDLITQNAMDWVDGLDKKAPYFLYLPYTTPHDPLQGPGDDLGRPLAPEEWRQLKGREKYIPLVESLDDNIGRLLKHIDKTKSGRETLVVFFSDNGGTRSANNGPFRGHKGQVFEGGIRVPCIVKWPGEIEANTVSDQACISFDLTKSMLAAAGIAVTSENLDGIDIVKHVVSKVPDVERTLFWRKKRGNRVFKAVRKGDLKYIVNSDNGSIIYEGLYDLKKDTSESVNLLPEDNWVKERFKRILDSWESEVAAKRLTGFRDPQ